jgi:hypothetical protein
VLRSAMDIHVKILDRDPPPANSLKPFTLKDNQIGLLPLQGDQISNDHIAREVQGRIFKYGKNEITVTLICGIEIQHTTMHG